MAFAHHDTSFYNQSRSGYSPFFGTEQRRYGDITSGFHLAIGGLTIIPVLHALLQDLGLALFGGRPAWGMGALLPAEVIFP